MHRRRSSRHSRSLSSGCAGVINSFRIAAGRLLAIRAQPAQPPIALPRETPGTISYIAGMLPDPSPYIIALGDSLTAGHGLPSTASFAARLQALLRDHRPGAVVQNAGISGDTTEGGLRRLPRLLAGLSRKPDLCIVELGANDFLRGIAPDRTRANLDAILHALVQCGIPALLATIEPPRFLGALGARYRGIHAELAVRHGAATAPFFPPGVLGHADLVLADGIHPNARAIDLVAAAFLSATLAALDRDRAAAA